MQHPNSDESLIGLGRSALGLLLALPLLLVFPTEGLAQGEMTLTASDRLAMSLIVYEDDLALVREQRLGGLRKGVNDIAFADVSAQLRPATVILSGAGLRMLEQRFAFDTITPRRLLEAAVGKQVRLITTHPQTGLENIRDATLLGVSEGPVLQLGERIEISPPGRIVLSEMPDGLRQGATFLAKVEAQAEGSGELGLTYLTRGLSWRADYIAHVDPKGDSLSLSTLVTLTNTSGGHYPDAQVSLVAGQVNQKETDVARQRGVSAKVMAQAVPEALESVAPRSVADRHVYSLPRRVSLPNRQTVQVSLFQATDVKVKREYRFESLVQAYPGFDEIGPVNASLQLRLNNDEENGLGQPLPRGTLRAYQNEEQAGLLFIGEDSVGHTPVGEEVRVSLGQAFDVTGRAKRTAYERISNKSYETGQEIILNNAKAEPVEVIVVGQMPPGWRLLAESQPHEKETANRVAWTVAIPAEGVAVLNYRVRVSR